MKKSNVIVAAAALTVAGILSAYAQTDQVPQVGAGIPHAVYDLKATVRNLESYPFIKTSICNKSEKRLMDTARVAKNTFSGYIVVETCEDCYGGANIDGSGNAWFYLTRSTDTQKPKKVYRFGGNGDEYFVAAAFQDKVGGLSYTEDMCEDREPSVCWPIAIDSLKTAQVAFGFAAGKGVDTFPTFYFGWRWDGSKANAGFATMPYVIRTSEDSPYRWTMWNGDTTPFDVWAPYYPVAYSVDVVGNDGLGVKARGFGSILTASRSIPGGPINCGPVRPGYTEVCRLVDKATGSLVGDFGYKTACGHPAVWDLCNFIENVQGDYDCYGNYGQAAKDFATDDNDWGAVEGTWSIALNRVLTQYGSFEAIQAAIYKNLAVTVGPMLTLPDQYSEVGPDGYLPPYNLGNLVWELPRQIAQVWDVEFDWGCEGTPGSTTITFYTDGTFLSIWGASGTWRWLSEDVIEWTYGDTDTVYIGVRQDDGSFSGNSVDGDGDGYGCWTASTSEGDVIEEPAAADGLSEASSPAN